MNTEQLRAEFEAWHKREMWDGGYESGHDEFYPDAYRFNERRVYENIHTQIAWRGYQASRAALQSQPQETIAYVTRNEEGDPAMLFFDLKEARLYCNPDEEPEALALAGSALQSQDREDAERYRYLITKLQQVYDGDYFETDLMSLYCHMPSQFKGDRVVRAEITWRDKTDEPIGLSAAIDHARRIEGDKG